MTISRACTSFPYQEYTADRAKKPNGKQANKQIKRLVYLLFIVVYSQGCLRAKSGLTKVMTFWTSGTGAMNMCFLFDFCTINISNRGTGVMHLSICNIKIPPGGAYHRHLTPSPSPGVRHLTNLPRGWGIWPIIHLTKREESDNVKWF